MKRILIFSISVLVALSSFAYGYYDSYNRSTSDWLIITGIVFFIWGILEIILFFKIWKMTNDVDKLRASLVDDKASAVTKMNLRQLSSAIKRKFYLGKVDEANEDLNLYTYKQFLQVEDIPISVDIDGNENLYVNVDGNTLKYNNHQEYIESVLKRVKPLYDAIGREIPKLLKDLKYDEFNSFGLVEENKK